MTTNTCNTNMLNIVVTGVGGQGVLTLAEILSRAVLNDGTNVRVGEIHGMAQRGGHVSCTVRIGSDVFGPIVDSGTAHIVVGFEPIETLREIHLIRNDGRVIMNTHIQYPVDVSMGKASYPSLETILRTLHTFTSNVFEFNAMELAEKAGSPRSMNMVMLGAIIGTHLVPVRKETILDAIGKAFPKQFEAINKHAFKLGYEITRGTPQS